MKLKISQKLLEEWAKEDKELREIRHKYADWDFINKQPPRIRLALLIYIETGDIYKAARIAELSLYEFNEIRKKAKIPEIIETTMIKIKVLS